MWETVPLKRPRPDIRAFADTIRGVVEPKRPPLAELYLDLEVVREISQSFLGREWVDPGDDHESQSAFYRNWIEVYHRMGYDYVWMSGGLDFPGKVRTTTDTAGLSRGNRDWMEEGTGAISSWADFEQYPWPDPDKADLWGHEFVADNLPEGMGMFVCPTSGFLEIPMDKLFGYENLCYLIQDSPELVSAVFQRVGEIIYAFYRRTIGLDKVYGFFQGDDMGFKTGTLISPNNLREYVFPWHRKLAELAHENGLLYLLHSCGHLDQIMEDLIDDIRIDARHSFEDEGNPVGEFKERYGDRVAVLGGVDVDKLTRLPEDKLREHVQSVIETCLPGGRFALGSGNSIANYVPIRNFFAMVEEGLNFG